MTIYWREKSLEDSESLFTAKSVSDAIIEWIENWDHMEAKELPKGPFPMAIRMYKSKEVDPSGWYGDLLCQLDEWMDENYGNPHDMGDHDGGFSDSELAVCKQLEKNLIDYYTSHYDVLRLEPTERVEHLEDAWAYLEHVNPKAYKLWFSDPVEDDAS